MREFSILILWVLISTLRRRSGLSKSLGISRVLALLSVIWTNQPKVLLDMLLLEVFFKITHKVFWVASPPI
ncbi:hypothetical protein JHK86_031022 [Glycine max]|nr:hypothetical protein JHK86_031022 [Glycine max]